MWFLHTLFNPRLNKIHGLELFYDPRPLVKLVYPVFHFKRTVPKRIKNISKFSECWLVNSSVVRQKVDLRRTFHFDTRMDLSTSFQSTHAHQSISTGGVHIKNITKNIKRKKTKSTTICTLPKATVNHDGVSQNKYMIQWIQTRLLTSKILFYTTFKYINWLSLLSFKRKVIQLIPKISTAIFKASLIELA
jgi:hypothetical protein